jgi:hypothetical protein
MMSVGCWDVGDITIESTPKLIKDIMLQTPGVFKLTINMNMLGIERFDGGVDDDYNWTQIAVRIASRVSLSYPDRPLIYKMSIEEFRKHYPWGVEIKSPNE